MSKDTCHKFACRLQSCLDKRGFDDTKCRKEIDAIKECCEEHWVSAPVTCEGFLRELKSYQEWVRREREKKDKVDNKEKDKGS